MKIVMKDAEGITDFNSIKPGETFTLNAEPKIIYMKTYPFDNSVDTFHYVSLSTGNCFTILKEHLSDNKIIKVNAVVTIEKE